MMILVSRSWETGKLFLDTCAVTLAITLACLRLPELSRIVVCEKDFGCFQDAIRSLLEEYTKQVLGPDSNTTGSEELVEGKQGVCERNGIPRVETKG